MFVCLCVFGGGGGEGGYFSHVKGMETGSRLWKIVKFACVEARQLGPRFQDPLGGVRREIITPHQ